MFILILALAAGPSSPGAAVDFDTDVLPLITRAGCNAASCHGAAAGRGGFKLSLFAGDPAADYQAIVRQHSGRRVNQTSPRRSLLIAKPSLQLEHEGGERFSANSAEAKLLARWITAGAPRLHTRQLKRLEAAVSPSWLTEVPARAQMAVTARFDDGTQRNVTAQAVFTPADPGAVSVDPSGVVHVTRPGVHVVVVRYLSQVQAVRIAVPLGKKPVDLTAAPAGNWIDKQVYQTLKQLRIQPAPRASNTALVRRVYLDLTGRLPSPAEAKRYVKETSPDKFKQLVDRLLSSTEFETYFTLQLAKLFRIGGKGEAEASSQAFYNWLKQQLHEREGFDSIARKMLLATGPHKTSGPANFYRAAGDARLQAEYFSGKFLSVRLRCANCHNHPLDHWTQDDYHGLAAIFAPVERGRVISFGGRGKAYHPRTGEPALKQIPGGAALPVNAKDPAVSGPAGITALANWLTARDNPYFASSIVNRLWKMMMGRGLVEPVDDLRSTNPASHPMLLEQIAADFAGNGYRLRHTLRTIANSAAYQRESRFNHAGARFYAVATPRPLAPEVLADALADVTGVADNYGGKTAARAVEIFNASSNTPSLKILGRCSQAEACAAGATSTAPGARAMLHLLNGPLLNTRISATGSRLQQLIAAGASNQKITGDFYWLAFSRNPTARETAFWQSELASGTTPASRLAVLEDFVWALLCSREFTTTR